MRTNFGEVQCALERLQRCTPNVLECVMPGQHYELRLPISCNSNRIRKFVLLNVVAKNYTGGLRSYLKMGTMECKSVIV